MAASISDAVSRRAEMRGARRWVLLALVLILAAAVVYHHLEPAQMDGMASGAVCLAVLGGGALIAIEALRRRFPRPTSFALPTPRGLAAPRPALGVPARAGPIYLRLAVLRR